MSDSTQNLSAADNTIRHLEVVRALLIQEGRNFDEAVVQLCLDVLRRGFESSAQAKLHAPSSSL